MKVGFTGHQNIGPKHVVDWIWAALSERLRQHKASYGYTCLAAGADQLFAKVLISKGLPFSVLIPCEGYETTFNDLSDLENYKRLVASSNQRIQVGFGPPTEESFYKAGQEIVDRADIVFAVWDGDNAKGLGGTGDIVAWAIQCGKTVVHLNSKTLRVEELEAGSLRAKQVLRAKPQ